MPLNFTVTENEIYTFVEMEINNPEGVLDPSDLAQIKAPSVPGHKGVIISGRCPVWVYSMLTHEYHPTAWVACYDPRKGGGVVTSRHTPNAPAIGSVVPLPKD